MFFFQRFCFLGDREPFLLPVKGPPGEGLSNRKWRENCLVTFLGPRHQRTTSTSRSIWRVPVPLRVRVTIFMRRVAAKLRLWRKNPAAAKASMPPATRKTITLVSFQRSTHRFHLCLPRCDHYVSIILSRLDTPPPPPPPRPLPKCCFRLW